MKKFEIKPEMLISVGLTALGVAQMVLSGQKEKADRAKMKAEIIEEVSKSLTKKED